MNQFYKSELSDDMSEWEEASITEKLGTPEEHTDKFYRRGPYGVEMDDDGHYEAYVLVADTPFKIGDGFSSFEEAVGFLREAMSEKKVPDTPEEKTEQENSEQENSEQEDSESEPVEKSDMKVGPEGGSVSKSFEDAYGYPDYDSMPQDEKQMYEEEAREQAAREMAEMESQKHDAFYKADDEGEKHKTELVHPEDVNEKHYIDDKPLGSAEKMSDSPDLEPLHKSQSFREMMEFRKANSHSSRRPMSTFDPKRDLRTQEQKEAEWNKLMMDRPELTGEDAWRIVERNRNMPPKQKYIENRHQNEEDKGVAYVPTQSSVEGKFMMPLNEAEEVRLKAGKRYMGADKLMHDPVPFDDRTMERRRGWGRKYGIYPQTEPGRRPTPDEWKYATEAEGEGITRGPATQTEWDPKIEHRGNYKDRQGDIEYMPHKREQMDDDVSDADMKLAQQEAAKQSAQQDDEAAKRKAQKEARRQRAAERQAKAQQESAPKTEAPKTETPEQKPAESPKEEQKPESDDSEDSMNPTTKSFRKMLEQRVGMKESQRGVPATHVDIGHPMRDGAPIRELYRTTVMGSGKDRTSPLTPKKAETKE